jgi:hypothetical protein
MFFILRLGHYQNIVQNRLNQFYRGIMLNANPKIIKEAINNDNIINLQFIYDIPNIILFSIQGYYE